MSLESNSHFENWGVNKFYANILISDCMKVKQGVILVKIGQDGEVSQFQPVLHQMHPLLGLERVSDDGQGPPGASKKLFYNFLLRIGS